MSKPLTKEQVKERILNAFPDWNCEVLEYKNAMTPCKVKCLKCGRETIYQQLSHLTHKKTPCVCTSDSSQYKSIQQIQELKKFFEDSEHFEVVEWTTMNDKKHKPAIRIKCKYTNQLFLRRTTTFYNDRSCPYCEETVMPCTYTVSKKLEENGYTLLSEYVNQDTPISIKHNECGFIWKVKPMNLHKGYQYICPHCNNIHSRGERKIMKYLSDCQIEYEQEKRFPWQSHPLFRYDFYIPKYNLIIEYHGEQHYQETPGFGRDDLETRRLHDKIKLQEALENGYYFLIIPYTHFSKIEKILERWFNDYPQGVDNKLTIIERNTIFSEDKNIV